MKEKIKLKNLLLYECMKYTHDTSNMLNYHSRWYKPQIFVEIDTEVPTIGPAQIYQTLVSSVNNHSTLKLALINRYGYSTKITQIFTENGF